MSLKTNKSRIPMPGFQGMTATHVTFPTGMAATSGTMQQGGTETASKEVKDILEKKIEELSRQLAEERQLSRHNRMSVARLQREITRFETAERRQMRAVAQLIELVGRLGNEGLLACVRKTGNRPDMTEKKESLSKELEHEKMLRVNAEQRLHEMTRETDGCRSRLHSLQDEFKKMEEMVQNMLEYKSKIDQLKQEKSSLSITYENNLQKFGSHISDLERENMVLLNEVKKLESQMNNKTTDGRDKSKLLMERLRMLEKENSSLVLENEQQRQQYEKCLDEIANQVVQALLAQKMLREECLKLQNRVHDLELQNHQLSILFHQRMKVSAQAIHQHTVNSDQPAEHDVFVEGSIESLQSIFSEQMSENLPSMPQMSTPPPWLQERLSLHGDHSYGDRLSIVSLPGSVQSAPDLNTSSENGELCFRTKIETEFPATPSSPKVKHINVFERKKENKRSSSTSSLAIPSRPTKVRTRSTSSLSRAKGLSLFQTQGNSQSSIGSGSHPTTSPNQGNSQSSIGSGSHPTTSPNQGNLQSGQSKLSRQRTSSQEKVVSHQVANQGKSNRVPSPVNQSGSAAQTSNSSSPVAQSSSPTRRQAAGSGNKPQGHIPRQTSKLPVSSSLSQNKEQVQRRNSKTESGIRMGCQSPVHKIQSTSTTNIKSPQSSSSSVTSGRLPSSSSSGTSRIPSAPKSTNKTQKTVKSTVKEKGNLTKKVPGSTSKIVPPGSPQVRHSGIKTTLKTEKQSPPSVIDSVSATINESKLPYNANAVNNANNKSALSNNISASKGKEVKTIPKAVTITPMPQWRHEGPYANPRPETHHFPRMGTSNFTHISPKTDLPSPKTENLSLASPNKFEVPNSASTPKHEIPNAKYTSSVHMNVSVSQGHVGQYFYDYSDEDSDWNRPVSKDFSIASSVSLDEMLNKTLENINTPADSDFDSFFVSTIKAKVKDIENENSNVPNEGERENIDNNSSAEKCDNNDNRLSGKPDIVKDTEKCEQRNLKKSLTISQIPGSGLTGYRARRPKSLVLGSKDRKFVYAEYGSSSSSDSSSDEGWSFQASYAKNVKQHEIQSKVAKSLKSGEAKEIVTPTNVSTLEVTLNTQNDKDAKTPKTVSQIPRPNLSKKPSKTPPPIALKPVKKNSPSERLPPRPKSVEICVNTVLAPPVSNPSPMCFPYLNSIEFLDEKKFNKYESEKFSTLPQAKTENGEKKLDKGDSFDEVKVERSGSRDDGYSTMSSDVQPEAMEKFSDENLKEQQSHCVCDSNISGTHSGEIKPRCDLSSDPDSALEMSVQGSDMRNSNQSLSSQNSFSSEDRHSQYGSLGRVKAMKLKYEIEIQNRSPERESMKSPPLMPPKSPKRIMFQDKSDNKMLSKIPLARQSNVLLSSKPQVPTHQSKLPMYQTANTHRKGAEPKSNLQVDETPGAINRESINRESMNRETVQSTSPGIYQKSDPIVYNSPSVNEQFSKLYDFRPPLEQISLIREGGCDDSSSASDRGSDLTSLHISEDNILSDIPEEKDEYESSVGKLSETNSLASIPMKKSHQTTLIHTCCQHRKGQFEVTLKKFWMSMSGLIRAVSESDLIKQNLDTEHSDFEDLYGGSLNIDTPLERSSSESDIHKKKTHPEKRWLPRLRHSWHGLMVDEIAVEGRVNDILKQIVFQQLTKTAESADSDDKTFSSYVEMLKQKGHVMDSSSTLHNMEASLQSRMSVSCTSSTSSMGHYSCDPTSKGHYSNENFDQEERLSRESSCGPLDEEQKQFKSQFYSLCNVGSNHSVSETSEPRTEDLSSLTQRSNTVKDIGHRCDKKDLDCKKCLEERNAKEFDEISKQIESLSKTVNELHKSLTSLNSENTDSGSESNEGDNTSLFNSAIGDKEIDGYQWLEDEFFLSPYGGEIILGASPFSDTGAPCDWMNEYIDDGNRLDEFSTSHEGLHEDTDGLLSESDKISSQKFRKSDGGSSLLSRMLDKEGNFNSHEFISRRLRQEEEKLESSILDMPLKCDSVHDVISDLGRSEVNPRVKRVLKEEMHTTPEKDDDTTLTDLSKMTQRHGLGLGNDSLNLSQDSLDDNIGVDQVMCHRLLGKGRNEMMSSRAGIRAGLDLSSHFFTRFGDLEKEAMAAFDFLHDDSTPVSSPDSPELVGSSTQVQNQLVVRTNSHNLVASPPQKQSVFGTPLDHTYRRLDNTLNSNIQIDQSNTDKMSHDQLSNVKVRRPFLRGLSLDQSVSSTDSNLSPVKKSRRKLRPKIKKDQMRAMRRGMKFSSTSADESFDELSFSDSCCYNSFSSSSDSLEDNITGV